MYSNFLLGNLRITDGAKIRLKRIPYDLIARHAVNEHGDLTNREIRRNEIAMKTIGEIMSRYRVDPTDASLGNVIVVTHECWDETLVKLETE
ncbi:hypothetical protein [Rhodoferax sp.]|uniref:hypothetical protein n=1 Tax=Rhodoferax sp. TaxID=50421 RepID=UPI00277454B5|nr:hypothetical protein [Rhodoferax sp.]